jgi:hypothetical protein
MYADNHYHGEEEFFSYKTIQNLNLNYLLIIQNKSKKLQVLFSINMVKLTEYLNFCLCCLHSCWGIVSESADIQSQLLSA